MFLRMPIYEYEHDHSSGTKCKERFDAVESMAAEPLKACPTCGAAVHRVISTFGVSAKGKGGLLSKSNLAKHGFTQYTRKGKGNYEKSAGTGPSAIVDGSS